MKRLTAALAASLLATTAFAQPDPTDWDSVLEEARGQTVYWNAWGGSTTTNDFIAWVGDRVAEEYGVTLEHVKLTDTADAVARVLAEQQAGTNEGGAIDIIWINGENFASMKRQDLLFGPFAEALPNWQYVDTEGKTVQTDFTIPTEGYESPWAMAQVVFMYDTADIDAPLPSMNAILEWSKSHPGRFTYPQPPDFLGATFLKQALLDLVEDPAPLMEPATPETFTKTSAPVWDFLEELTPNLWRKGETYPQSGPQQIQLLNDDEIDLAISFSPGEASTAISNFELPDTVRTFVLDKGTLGNASYLAIPYNANAAAGAMVVANFILSPEAQAHGLDPLNLGYGTVLDMDKLSDDQKAAFDAIDLGIATLTPAELGTALPEPHPSWMEMLETEWTARYGVQ